MKDLLDKFDKEFDEKFDSFFSDLDDAGIEKREEIKSLAHSALEEAYKAGITDSIKELEKSYDNPIDDGWLKRVGALVIEGAIGRKEKLEGLIQDIENKSITGSVNALKKLIKGEVPKDNNLERLIEKIDKKEYFQLSWLAGAKHWQARYKFGLNIGEKFADGSTPTEALQNLIKALEKK